jgi:hypothetical protein
MYVGMLPEIHVCYKQTVIIGPAKFNSILRLNLNKPTFHLKTPLGLPVLLPTL